MSTLFIFCTSTFFPVANVALSFTDDTKFTRVWSNSHFYAHFSFFHIFENIPACCTAVSWHLEFAAPSDKIKLSMTWKCLSQHDSLTWQREQGVGSGEHSAGTNNILCIPEHTQKGAHLHCITPHSLPRSITASSVYTPSLSANDWGQV